MVGLCIAVRTPDWSLTNRPREPSQVPVDGLAYQYDASSTITAGFPDRSQRTRGAYVPVIKRFLTRIFVRIRSRNSRVATDGRNSTPAKYLADRLSGGLV